MIYEFIIRNKRALMILIGIGFLGLCGGIYLLAGQKSGIPTDVYIVPQDAVATVDGTSLTAGKSSFSAGTHDVVVRKYGFNDYHESIQITAAHASIDVALVPVSSEATQWAQKNANLYKAKEARASQHLNADGQQFSKDNPIVNQLPIDNLVYSIGYRRATSDQNNNAIILEIDAMQGYRNGAIKKIKDLGYDPADFIINFRDYRNPFEL